MRDDSTVYIMLLVPGSIKLLRDFAEKEDLLDRAHCFYIYSPHQEVLRQRLEKRGDSMEEIEKRLKDCVRWDSEAKRSGIPYEFVKNNF